MLVTEEEKYESARIQQRLQESFHEVLKRFPGAVRRNGSMARLSRRHQRRLTRRLRLAALKVCLEEESRGSLSLQSILADP